MLHHLVHDISQSHFYIKSNFFQTIGQKIFTCLRVVSVFYALFYGSYKNFKNAVESQNIQKIKNIKQRISSEKDMKPNIEEKHFFLHQK